ncbi:MAG: hypothetical protein HUJ26_22835 [Planctomycetaceae bacterium]|nr:hypothetical protein [Planctomycetaceae bacterium]
MTPEVEEAIQELKKTFGDDNLSVTPDSDGGAFVIIHNIDLGEKYQPPVTWIGFRITFQCPEADVYPHFIDGNVKRSDGTKFGKGFSGPRKWQERHSLQISRRSHHINPLVDTPTTKLIKVIQWIQDQ